MLQRESGMRVLRQSEREKRERGRWVGFSLLLHRALLNHTQLVDKWRKQFITGERKGG